MAVIGTGASANQVVPAVAPVAEKLVVFQRSAHWMMSHPKYGKVLQGIEKALFQVPTYREWHRFSEGWKFGDGVTPLVQVDPARAESVLEDLAELFRVALVDKGQAVSLAE